MRGNFEALKNRAYPSRSKVFFPRDISTDEIYQINGLTDEIIQIDFLLRVISSFCFHIVAFGLSTDVYNN